MTQITFDFLSPETQGTEKTQEIQKWVNQHNQKVIASAQVPSASFGSLLSALQEKEVAANSVYMVRGLLGQQMRKSISSGSFDSKKMFLQTLKAEMCIKKTNRDPILILRDVLIKIQPMR